MIVDIKVRVATDPRGKITAGTTTAEGKMQKLDYFNVEPFPELIKAYGRKPAALVVFAPTDTITDFFDCWYERWGGGKKAAGKAGVKMRRCDGRTCVHLGDETAGGIQYAAGQETPCVCKNLPEEVERDGKMVQNQERCRYHAWLKVFIGIPQMGRPENPLCYEFHTHSKNSGDAVVSELQKIQAMNENHRIAGVPFMIGVKVVKGPKRSFPVWTIRAIGTITQIHEGKFLSMPDQATAMLEQGSIEMVDEEQPEARPQLTQPAFNEHDSMLQELKDHIRDMMPEKAPDAIRHILKLLNEGKITAEEHNMLQLKAQARAKYTMP